MIGPYLYEQLYNKIWTLFSLLSAQSTGTKVFANEPQYFCPTDYKHAVQVFNHLHLKAIPSLDKGERLIVQKLEIQNSFSEKTIHWSHQTGNMLDIVNFNWLGPWNMMEPTYKTRKIWEKIASYPTWQQQDIALWNCKYQLRTNSTEIAVLIVNNRRKSALK